MGGSAYRCDACRHAAVRCKACRKRRAAVRRGERAKWRKLGLCILCGDKCAVVDGEPLTRCKVHREENRVRSLKSHSKEQR